MHGPKNSSFSSCGRISAGTSLQCFLQISYIRLSTVATDGDPVRMGSIYRSHLNAVSDDASRYEKLTPQAADWRKGWNKINAVNYFSKIVWLAESLGKWATDILGGLQMQLAHNHARSLTPHIFTQKLSLGKCFFFFFSSKSYLLTPAMDTADSASVISSLLLKKKDAEESGSLTRPSKHSEYFRPTARAAGPHIEPFDSFWSRQFREKEKTQLQMTHRKEEKGGGGWSRTVCDSRWSVHICTRLCWLRHNLLWARAEGGEKSHRSSCEKPSKATKCVPGGGVCRARPHAAHFWSPAGTGGFDGRWFLNVSNWWKSSSCPPLEPFSFGWQGRMWRAAPLLAGLRMNRWMEGPKWGRQEETEKQANWWLKLNNSKGK